MTVYVGGRDLSGLPIGTHQFIVITYPTRQSIMIGRRVFATKLLGPSVHGIVIGAQNRGTLNVEMFEKADTQAAKEHFGGAKKVWHKSDYDTEMKLVRFNGSSSTLHHERKLISLVDAYYLNQTLDPIIYPTAGAGFNSNSWTQSLVQYSGGQVDSNMKGLDIHYKRRIPETYFIPYCPSEPRVKLNQ